MKSIKLVLLVILAIGSKAVAEEQILCTEAKTLTVLSNTLNPMRSLFIVKQYETVVPFQGFIVNEQTRLENLKTVTYIRVEFPNRSNGQIKTLFRNGVYSGWVDKSLVKEKSKCESYQKLYAVVKKPTPKPVQIVGAVNGLNDKTCCFFPLFKNPSESYQEGMKVFGYRRDNGKRRHAAADLYQSQYTPVRAIADGVVLRDRVPFYLGTSVTEVRHGSFVVRYGEIASPSLKPLKVGEEVKAGQVIGYIKKVNSKGVYSAMLHFELYSGSGKGPLSTGRGVYQRRSDLINPTQYLLKWQEKL